MTLHDNNDVAAQNIIDRLGKRIIMGIPIGIGKPVGLVNAMYRLAEKDESIKLTILTGLTLTRPQWHSDLEKRFIEPLAKKILTDYEDPLYEIAREHQQLPANIKVIEFFLTPGLYLHNKTAQQDYISTSYSNAVNDLLQYSINVVAQLVSHTSEKTNEYSLSCNTDLFTDLVTALKAKNQDTKNIAIVAEVNNKLPFMTGEAVIDESVFTDIIDSGQYHALFAATNPRLTPQDHMIGLYTSALIKDGGCIQVGFGKRGDAIANALIFRQKNNESYHQLMLKKLKLREKFSSIIISDGSLDKFEQGLYASTEMLSDCIMHLFHEKIVKKKVYDEPVTGEKLQSGKVIHAGFFMGTNKFYDDLRNMNKEDLDKIAMVSISRTNTLSWSPELSKEQRKDARLINYAMMVTLEGSVISDGLVNWIEVSGIGGQVDFAEMAQKLPAARFIINCQSTREKHGKTVSNIIWDYSNITLPRYMRDVVVTEYGIADCRGKTDADTIKALLNITDSRFQGQLLAQAKKHGKITADYEIPVSFKNNFPNEIESIAAEYRDTGEFAPYPFGSDLTYEEQVLQQVLLTLKNSTKLQLGMIVFKSFISISNDASSSSYLIRMNLLHPKTVKEYIYKKILKYLIHHLSIEKNN